MTSLQPKKEIILEGELAFANAIGAAVVEKPKVSLWMILIPIYFLFFIYRMQKYKNGRRTFTDEFMTTRRRALNAAEHALSAGQKPDIEQIVRQAALSKDMEASYAAWINVLVDYYCDLMSATGDDFADLVQTAYGSRTNFLLVQNRLSQAEKAFYTALRPQMEIVPGAWDIIASIESHSQQLRRNMAEQIFP